MKLARLGLVLFVPLLFWGCLDKEDDPTGPDATNNPQMDVPRAKLTATAPHDVNRGDIFDIIAIYQDANGRPVQGVQIIATSENSCFTFITNPTWTNDRGGCSISVQAGDAPGGGGTNLCTPGSYGFRVHTGQWWEGAYSEDFVHLIVH